MRNVKARFDNANRPTKDEFGRPLGERRSTRYVWYPVRRTWRKERKTVDGRTGTLLPYSYGIGERPSEGPRGGKAVQQFWWRLYCVLFDGRPLVCRARHERVDRLETGEFVYRDYWEPYTGHVEGCYDGFRNESYTLVDGVAV